MTELERIQDQLRKTFAGPAWHGPSVLEQLADLSEVEAAAHPLPGCHSMDELVAHMAAWRRLAVHRLKGDSSYKVGPDLDWPQLPRGDGAWESLQEALRQTQRELLAAVRNLDPKELDELVPGSEYSWHSLLHGVMQHDLYHLGQIGMMKKILRSQ